MATVVLGAVGSAIGGPVGGAIGSVIGSVIDNFVIGLLTPAQKVEGPRLNDINVQTSTEGAGIPRGFGYHRLAGQVFWASRFTETKQTTSSGGGGKGGGGGAKTKTTEYLYSVSFAVGLCQGEVARHGRIWANGELLDTSGLTLRFYPGSETQSADVLMEQIEGTGNNPAYRGLCYLVFEDFPLADYGNGLPQLQVELVRALGAGSAGALEDAVEAVTLIPGAGEFAYSTALISANDGDGGSAPENSATPSVGADIVNSLDDLEAVLPNCANVSLVTGWFGSDLRVGSCAIRPKVDNADKDTSPDSWQVSGVARGAAQVVSSHDGGPAYGGTPSDKSVFEAITELKARGLGVTFYPFILMDVAEGNSLPDPRTGFPYQPQYPWRGRITCDPAPMAQNLAVRTADFSGYVVTSTPVLTYAQADPWGGTEAIAVEDDDGAAAEALNTSPLVTSPAVGARIFGAVFVRKNPAATWFATLRIAINAGGGVVADLKLDLTSGALATVPGAGVTVHASGVDSVYDDAGVEWYRVWGIVSHDTTVPSARLLMFPAAGTVFPTSSVAALGTARFAGPQIAVSAVKLDYYRNPSGSEVVTVDKTATAATQLENFVGTAAAGDFGAWNGDTIPYSGPAEWTFRRMILHYAKLCAAAGGVDNFLIGSELVGLTQMRSAAATYPFVADLQTLAADVSAILGGATLVGYAADWSEYHSHRPTDGSGDIYFNLDPLWADANIDFIGIDNYLPASDWRDGVSHLDYDAVNGPWRIHDTDYLQANIAGGEYHAWYYASSADRDAQTRTTIADNLYGYPWIFGQKRLRDWWSSFHHSRAAGQQSNLLPDSGNPQSAAWTLLGGAVKTAVVGTHLEYFALAAEVASGGNSADRITRFTAAVAATGTYRVTALFKAGTSGKRFLRMACSANSLGLSGTIGAAPTYANVGFSYSNFSETDLGGGYWRAQIDVVSNAAAALAVQFGPNSAVAGENVVLVGADVVRLDATSSASTGLAAQAKPIWFTELGCPAIDKGANQPNVFTDPKSSESFAPYYSSGERDDLIQRMFIEAHYAWWGDVANNPVSSVYGQPMVDTAHIFAWTWDARPFPFFPAFETIWTDAANYHLGHWLNGRAGAVPLDLLVSRICDDHGFADYDVSDLRGMVTGYIVTGPMTARAALQPLMTALHFDAVESGGLVKFVMRGRPAATAADEDGVVMPEDGGASLACELSRTAETALPVAFRISYIEASVDYRVAQVEQQRLGGDAIRVVEASLPLMMDQGQAIGVGERLIQQAWLEREQASFTLPPSLMALDPGDEVELTFGGRQRRLRLTSAAIGRALEVKASGTDPSLYEPFRGPRRAMGAVSRIAVPGRALLVFADLPVLSSEANAWAPYLGVYATPWAGAVNIHRSSADEGYTLDTQVTKRVAMGVTGGTLGIGPESIWDMGNTISVRIYEGTLASASELEVLNGANAIAVENADGDWEILQFVTATLTGTQTWTLSQLLRGQLGTEAAMVGVAAGARVLVLDDNLYQPGMPRSQFALPFYYRWGPATQAIGSDSYQTEVFTGEGVGLRCYSPVQVSSVTAAGDVTISWVRRDRIGGDAWEATEIPMSESAESYELDVFDGAAVVRTLTAATPEATYTAAQMTTDFGAPPSSFDIEVYQISSITGRGTGRAATITV